MLHVLKCGHDSKHRTVFRMVRKTGVPHHILLLVKTDAYFELDGELVPTGPNQAILFDRNTPMHYGCFHEAYNDDWIHFDCDESPSLPERLGLPMNRPIALPRIDALSNLVRLLVQESRLDEAKTHRAERLDATMRLILFTLADQFTGAGNGAGTGAGTGPLGSTGTGPLGSTGIRQLVSTCVWPFASTDAAICASTSSSPLTTTSTAGKRETAHQDRLERLRADICNTPHHDWTVAEMARRIRVSPSHFQHLYREAFGLSCKQEVIAARLERAKFHLSTTDVAIGPLAALCGFENESHFIRLFRAREGMTPMQYRRVYRTGDGG